MRVAIICEYNPFHNGHLYQINQVKENHPQAEIICFMSGDFCQRGIPAITSKFNRSKAAIDAGADLVVELNQLEVIQAAHIFANTAVAMFENFNITHICFGSESGDINNILEADINIVKGESLASSINLKSNDRLGYFYLEAIKQNKLKVEPLIVKRDNDYFESIESATGIRKLIKEGKDYSKLTPMTITQPNFLDYYFQVIKYKLEQTTSEQLSKIFLVDNGIENLLIKNIKNKNTLDEFVDSCTSKVHTKSRIYRTLLFILLDITEVNKQTTWRLLGSSNKDIQKEVKEYLHTGAPNEIEEKIMNLYNLCTKDKDYHSTTLKGIPYIK